MFKKRYFSVKNDFKTSFLCKFFIYLGITFIFIFIVLSLISYFNIGKNSGPIKTLYDISITSIPESILSFSIIFIAVGIILYFFNCQFAKLAKIADEIENEDVE
jgi:hypothetical protein